VLQCVRAQAAQQAPRDAAAPATLIDDDADVGAAVVLVDTTPFGDADDPVAVEREERFPVFVIGPHDSVDHPRADDRRR
jgi:hypothetical protein